MSWFANYPIIGGLLAGGGLQSDGSLQSLWDFPSASRTISGNIALANRLDFSDPTWAGAYGTDMRQLINHAMAAVDGGNTGEWYLLAEILVPNPEGAQYWRQTYVIEVMDNNTCRYRENSRTVSGVTYYCRWFECQFSFRVARYQYDTPYSGYARTDLSANSNRGTGMGCTILEGDGDAVYYAFTGGWVWDDMLLSVGTFSNNNVDYFGVSMWTERDRPATYQLPHPDPTNRYSFGLIGQSVNYLNTLYGLFEPEKKEDPNEEEPPAEGPGKGGSGGGEGGHTLPDEPVPVPALPELYPGAINWIQLYKMSLSDINAFGSEFVDPTGWDIVKTFFSDPLDAIVGITLIPVSAPERGARTPHVGSFTWSRAFTICNEFAEIDCGYIDIAPYWDSAFDFNPYTTITIFLPFIGYKHITADEVMGGRIGVKYHVDVCTGDCVAFVTKVAQSESIYGPMPPQVIAQFNGNCATRVPIGRVSHDAAITASMSLFGSALNIGAAAAGVASGLSDPGSISGSQVANQISSATMTAVNGLRQPVDRSGNIAGTGGYMAILRPYIIRQIPRQDLPTNYKRLEGYPANRGGTLSQYTGSGLQAVEVVELNNITCYDSERTEILSLLRGGVIV